MDEERVIALKKKLEELTSELNTLTKAPSTPYVSQPKPFPKELKEKYKALLSKKED